MHCIQLRNGSRYPPKCRLRDSLHALKRYTEATAADKKRLRNGFHHYRSMKRYGIQLDSATDNAGTPNVFWTNGSLHGKSTHACKVILNHYRTLFNFSNQCRGGHMINFSLMPASWSWSQCGWKDLLDRFKKCEESSTKVK
jgi:hypothetical protein